MIQIYTPRLLNLLLICPGQAFLLAGNVATNTIVVVATTNTVLTTAASAAAAAGRCREIAHAGTHAARVAPVGRLDRQDLRLGRQRWRPLLVVGVAAAATGAARRTRAASGAAATAGACRQPVLLLIVVLMVGMPVVRRVIDDPAVH